MTVQYAHSLQKNKLFIGTIIIFFSTSFYLIHKADKFNIDKTGGHQLDLLLSTILHN